MELTSHLILLKWLLMHTYITSQEPISNKIITNIFLSEYPELKKELKDINRLIGLFLKYIYGNQLKKQGVKHIVYNIGIVKEPIKKIYLQDHNNIYDFEHYTHKNKSYFVDVKQTYKTLNHIFKGAYNKYGNSKPLKKHDLIKCDNLCKDVIVYCINKGIPKNLLKYFWFYCMSFINAKDLNLILHDVKKEYRQNKVCAVCGASDNLTIHHVKEVSKYPYYEFNTSNFIVLCDSCHKKHHQNNNNCGGV